MTLKDQYIKVWQEEFPATLKVLKAYPAEKPDWKPTPKARSAKELAWTFLIEERALDDALTKGKVDFGESPPPPETMEEVITILERSHKDLSEKMEKSSEGDFKKSIHTPVGPGIMGDVPIINFAWMMLMDSIHHRGQMTVYIRMAGGKVPSIYGPSGDEPWD